VSVNLGLIYIIIIAVIVPFLVVALLRLWPHTSFGKRLLVQPPTDDDLSPAALQQQQLKQLIGQLGTAKTKMLPSGIITIGTQSFDAIGEGSSIEPGQTLRVKRVEMNYLVVERCDDVRQETLENLTFD
jgi:membrane protein implicated in regulation of membrane protease activity